MSNVKTLSSHGFAKFKKVAMEKASCWTVDCIHDGKGDRRLLAYAQYPADKTTGLFVNINAHGNLTTGVYEGAVERITDGLFYPKVDEVKGSKSAALAYCVEQLNIAALASLAKQVH